MKQRIRKKQLKKINKYINPRELWNLDITIAKFILPRLIEFKKVTDFYPEEVKNFENWIKILDKIIVAFQYIAKGEMFNMDTNEKYNIIQNKMDEGLDLFRQYYFHLWY